jgi:hypothetical protein
MTLCFDWYELIPKLRMFQSYRENLDVLFIHYFPHFMYYVDWKKDYLNDFYAFFDYYYKFDCSHLNYC